MISSTLRKQRLTILGLNSGTSADALDMAVVQITRQNKTVRCRFLTGSTKSFPADLSRLIHKIIQNEVSLEEGLLAHQALGEFFGKSAAGYLKALSRRKIAVDLIASHGQTLLHIPEGISFGKKRQKATFQGGQLEEIASATGKPVVGDFRQADIAAGGEGAPITGAAMHRLFASPRTSPLIVNIGGISNFFYFPQGKKAEMLQAADCGPGNSLSDLLARKLFNRSFDQNGAFAARGKASMRLLSMLLAHPFYSGKLQSTGREVFGQNMMTDMVRSAKQLGINEHDLMATAVELTTISIAKAVHPILARDRRLDTLYVMGGGRKNRQIMKRLQHQLPNIKVTTVDELGINGDYVEASCYATMGEAFIRGEQLPVPRKKGISVALRLGKYVPAPIGK